MKRSFFVPLVLLFILLNTTSCTKHVYPVVYDGSKADATVTMYYEYRQFEKPVVHWEKARKDAIDRCRNWGYSNAEFFENGIQDCVQSDSDGDCRRWRVYFTCQCLE